MASYDEFLKNIDSIAVRCFFKQMIEPQNWDNQKVVFALKNKNLELIAKKHLDSESLKNALLKTFGFVPTLSLSIQNERIVRGKNAPSPIQNIETSQENKKLDILQETVKMFEGSTNFKLE